MRTFKTFSKKEIRFGLSVIGLCLMSSVSAHAFDEVQDWAVENNTAQIWQVLGTKGVSADFTTIYGAVAQTIPQAVIGLSQSISNDIDALKSSNLDNELSAASREALRDNPTISGGKQKDLLQLCVSMTQAAAAKKGQVASEIQAKTIADATTTTAFAANVSSAAMSKTTAETIWSTYCTPSEGSVCSSSTTDPAQAHIDTNAWWLFDTPILSATGTGNQIAALGQFTKYIVGSPPESIQVIGSNIPETRAAALGQRVRIASYNLAMRAFIDEQADRTPTITGPSAQKAIETIATFYNDPAHRPDWVKPLIANPSSAALSKMALMEAMYSLPAMDPNPPYMSESPAQLARDQMNQLVKLTALEHDRYLVERQNLLINSAMYAMLAQNSGR